MWQSTHVEFSELKRSALSDCAKRCLIATHDWRDLDQAMYSADGCTGVSYQSGIENMPLLN
jgi:hypothetical protein